MKKIYGGVCVLVTLVINTGCPKPCVESRYLFSVNSKIYPDADSIKIGDTLFISSTFPNNLIDQNSGLSVDYSNANDIESTLSIAELVYNDSVPRASVNAFKYYSAFGSIYNSTTIPSPNLVQQLKYQQVNVNYKLLVGLIPQHTGVYALGIGSGLSNSRANSGECEKASFQFSISNTNQHIYYYRNWRSDINLSASDVAKLYCFKVY